MADLVREFWGVILSFVGFVVWLVRLEGLGKQNAGEIRAIWRQRNEDLESNRRAQDQTNELLAEIRGDIKTISAQVILNARLVGAQKHD